MYEEKMKIKGVIFDMDGVILDSEKYYVRFWSEAGKACGYPFEEKHALAIRSMARPYAIERLKGFFGESFDYDMVRNKRIELMDAYVNENGIDSKPYARDILSYLKKNGYKIALATATVTEKAKSYLSRLDLLGYFDEVISAHMVKRGKPAPDIYLFASEKLGLCPEECMAVEDSPNGARSAVDAGCVTILVPDMDKPEGEITQRVYKTADGLKELSEILEAINGGE